MTIMYMNNDVNSGPNNFTLDSSDTLRQRTKVLIVYCINTTRPKRSFDSSANLDFFYMQTLIKGLYWRKWIVSPRRAICTKSYWTNYLTWIFVCDDWRTWRVTPFLGRWLINLICYLDEYRGSERLWSVAFCEIDILECSIVHTLESSIHAGGCRRPCWSWRLLLRTRFAGYRQTSSPASMRHNRRAARNCKAELVEARLPSWISLLCQ